MKLRAFLSFVSQAILIGSAIAADIPSRKAPVVPSPAPSMWTGFYAGVNAGGTWANNSQIQTGANPVYISPDQGTSNSTNAQFSTSAVAGLTTQINSGNSLGFIGGGQLGYNWQFEKIFVAGIEADIQGIAGSNSNNNRTFNSLNIFGINNFNQQF